MRKSLQITSHNLKLGHSMEEKIRTRAEKLEQYCNDLSGCRVTVDKPHRHHQKGALFQVSIDLRMPGAELIVKSEPESSLPLALRAAFDTACRRLKAQRQRWQPSAAARRPHSVAGL